MASLSFANNRCPTCRSAIPRDKIPEKGGAYKLSSQYDSVVVGAVTETHVYFSDFNKGEASAWSRVPLSQWFSIVTGRDDDRNVNPM